MVVLVVVEIFVENELDSYKAKSNIRHIYVT